MIGKFKEFKNKCTKDCPKCEGELVLKNIVKTPLITLKEALGKFDRSFYGGNVTKFTLTECPTCHAPILIYLKNTGTGLKIHDVAITDKALDSEYVPEDNEGSPDVQTPEQNAENLLSGAVGLISETDAEQASQAPDDEVDARAVGAQLSADIIEGVKELDEEKTLAAIKAITFGYLPKTLVAAGFAKTQIYNDQGKNLKKAEYITLVENYFKDAKQAIEQANNEEA